MNESNFKWSISTIKIFLDNVDPDKAIEHLTNKDALNALIEDLRYDNNILKEDFTEDDDVVKQYELAVTEISEWISTF